MKTLKTVREKVPLYFQEYPKGWRNISFLHGVKTVHLGSVPALNIKILASCLGDRVSDKQLKLSRFGRRTPS